MELTQWQDLYTSVEQYYDGFYASEQGKKAWELAYNALEKDENEDDEEPIIVAHDIVMEALEGWLINDIEEKEWEKANKWFEKMRQQLSESVFSGLS